MSHSWHDCVLRSQGNPLIPLSQALCPVDCQVVQVMLVFWCEHCYWITHKLFNGLICSSSCTEPQGCCCERSEQQQTCSDYFSSVNRLCCIAAQRQSNVIKHHQRYDEWQTITLCFLMLVLGTMIKIICYVMSFQVSWANRAGLSQSKSNTPALFLNIIFSAVFV